jgi:hypothetical protein
MYDVSLEKAGNGTYLPLVAVPSGVVSAGRRSQLDGRLGIPRAVAQSAGVANRRQAQQRLLPPRNVLEAVADYFGVSPNAYAGRRSIRYADVRRSEQPSWNRRLPNTTPFDGRTGAFVRILGVTPTPSGLPKSISATG